MTGILFLTPEYYPVWGGIGSYVQGITKNLPKDIDIHILTMNRNKQGRDNNPESERSQKNIVVKYIGDANDTFFFNIKYQLSCKKTIKKYLENNDINIIHSQSSLPDLFVNPKDFKIPFITTIHTTIQGQAKAIRDSNANLSNMDRSEKMNLIFGSIGTLMENLYYSKRNKFITVSEWGKKEFSIEKRIPDEEISVVHNGINLSEFDEGFVNNNVFPEIVRDDDRPKILFLSRMIERKGLDTIRKCIPIVSSKLDVNFIMAGTGGCTIPSGNNVTNLGKVTNIQKKNLYKYCDAFILPSHYENLPISILEAMASKLPVISTNVGGIPEIIDNGVNGILIPPKNEKELAEAIRNLIENPSHAKDLGTKGYLKVKNNFTWDRAANNTLQIYNSMVIK